VHDFKKLVIDKESKYFSPSPSTPAFSLALFCYKTFNASLTVFSPNFD